MYIFEPDRSWGFSCGSSRCIECMNRCAHGKIFNMARCIDVSLKYIFNKARSKSIPFAWEIPGSGCEDPGCKHIAIAYSNP